MVKIPPISGQQTLHYYSSNPCRAKKFTRISPKNQIIPAHTPKIHKTPIYTLLFLLKNRYFLLFFGKKAKKREKIVKNVKKRKFLKTDFAKSTQKHPKTYRNDLLY